MALLTTLSSGVDVKESALFSEGECNGWVHRYYAGIPLKIFKKLSSTSSPFLCYSCSLQTHERDTAVLNERVNSLAADLRKLLDGGAADKERATKGPVTLPITVSNAGHRRPSQDGENGMGGDVGSKESGFTGSSSEGNRRGEGLEEGEQVGRVIVQLEVDLLIPANPVSER